MGRRGPKKIIPRQPHISFEPPIKLSKLPPAAEKAWQHFERILRERGVLSHGDGFALERLCMLYDRIKKTEKRVKRDGEFYTTPAGMSRRTPWAIVLKETERDFNRMLLEFGLTPASRPDVQPLDTPGGGGHHEFFND